MMFVCHSFMRKSYNCIRMAEMQFAHYLASSGQNILKQITSNSHNAFVSNQFVHKRQIRYQTQQRLLSKIPRKWTFSIMRENIFFSYQKLISATSVSFLSNGHFWL